MAASTREIYVYYRVAAEDAASLLERVRAMQEGLREAHPGLQARLLRRPVAGDAPQTWMEVYAIAGGVSEDLQAKIEAAAAPLVAPRHCEVFEAVPHP